MALKSAAALAVLPFGGCALTKPWELVCPTSPEVHYPKGPLTIDVHCHVFNGTDLQVGKFLSMVVVEQGDKLARIVKLLEPMLQWLAWQAPTGGEELAILNEVEHELPFCSEDKIPIRMRQLRQDGYVRARAQLRRAVDRSVEFRRLRRSQGADRPAAQGSDAQMQQDAVDLIDAMPEKYEDFRSARPGEFGLRGPDAVDLKGFYNFIVQNFQYRYVSAHEYLRTYNRQGKRVFDLIVPSLVDYDWWLAQGDPTKTPLSTQVDVMEMMAIVTRGRVHALVPYDPLREVAHELGYADGGSFDLVRDAVENRGCIGVKLYPTMGVAPYGNQYLVLAGGGNFWKRDWLPKWTDRRDLGELLDRALDKFYSWCVECDVPVMAHTNLTNGVAKDFEALTDSPYWDRALALHPKLRVSFGHFGGTEMKSGEPMDAAALRAFERAERFTKLMHETGSGEHAFADSGFFIEAIDKAPEMVDALVKLYKLTEQKGAAALASRFMYGTDWEMVLTHGDVGDYLEDFLKVLEDMEKKLGEELAPQFFGGNAARWLGLANGNATRDRLKGFYKKHAVPEPDWVAKIDAIRPTEMSRVAGGR